MDETVRDGAGIWSAISWYSEKSSISSFSFSGSGNQVIEGIHKLMKPHGVGRLDIFGTISDRDPFFAGEGPMATPKNLPVRGILRCRFCSLVFIVVMVSGGGEGFHGLN